MRRRAVRSAPAHPAGTEIIRLVDLIETKAWDLLGITGQEFMRNWYARAYDGDARPEVVALDSLMRTGRWEPPIAG